MYHFIASRMSGYEILRQEILNEVDHKLFLKI